MKDVQDYTNSARICEEDEDDDEDAFMRRQTPKQDSSLQHNDSKTNLDKNQTNLAGNQAKMAVSTSGTSGTSAKLR